jgi:tRNA (cmo5U34)-methyltransferase
VLSFSADTGQVEGVSMAGADTYFNTIAPSYDSQARRGIPRYDEMLAELAESLPVEADSVLELGGGTGALTRRLVARFPKASIDVVDASEGMLEVLRRSVLRDEAPRLQIVHAAFEDLARPAGIYDLVTSSMSLHHVIDKTTFYTSIHTWLRPGGFLIFADELTGAIPHIQACHWDRWLAFAGRTDGLTREELEECLEHVETYDHYETLPNQLSFLKAAGFSTVDCVWRHLNYAIFVAAVSS